MNFMYGVIVVTAAIYDIYMYVMQNPDFLALWEIKQKVEGKVFLAKWSYNLRGMKKNVV